MATNRRNRSTGGKSTRGSKREGKNAIKVDLSGVETRKNLPEGQYMVTLNSATVEQSQNSGNDYIKFEFEVTDGKYKGAKLYHNSSLQPQALFNLKAVLTALGFSIPNKAFELELEDLIGLTCVVEVAHETYQNEKRARIIEFLSSDDEDYDEDYDEDDDEEDYEEMTLADLREECKSRGIKFPQKAKKRTLINLLEEDDEE